MLLSYIFSKSIWLITQVKFIASPRLGSRKRAPVLHHCVGWSESAELINIALKNICTLYTWACVKEMVSWIQAGVQAWKSMHPQYQNHAVFIHIHLILQTYLVLRNREVQVRIWSRWIQHVDLVHPTCFFQIFSLQCEGSTRFTFQRKHKKNNTPNSGHASCWYRAYPGSHKHYPTEKPVLPGHTGRNPSASAGSLEKRVVLRNKTSLLWSCRRRGPFPWQWGNWQSLKRTELILLRACRWQWLKQTHQPFFSAPSTGSLNKERSPWEILETPKENHFTRILTLLLNTFKLAYAAVCGAVSPFFVSKLNSYPHAALQEKPSSQFSKALLKRQARYRSLGHLIHPVLGWHSPPRDPIRKEGQTEILTQSSLKQHRHTGIAAMDETPFVFKTWEANISVSLQTQLYFPTL